MLKIWGRISSINVQKVALAAADMGIPFERIDAGAAFGKNKTPEYLAMNPNGLVPVIEDGGHVMWESNAILRYLCTKHSAGKLCPGDLATRATADQWMDWQACALVPAMFGAFWTLIRTPVADRDPAVVEASRVKTEAAMEILDAHLSKHEWVAGKACTMAELALVPTVHRWFGLPMENIARPHAQRWYEAFIARGSAKGILTLPVV